MLTAEFYNSGALAYSCPMDATTIASRSADAQSPSLRSFLAGLPEDDILRISEPMELDYLPTALDPRAGKAPPDAGRHHRTAGGF